MMREEIVDAELHEDETSTLDDATVAELTDRLEAYMARNGLRSTAQRRLVTDTFFRSKSYCRSRPTLTFISTLTTVTDPPISSSTRSLISSYALLPAAHSRSCVGESSPHPCSSHSAGSPNPSRLWMLSRIPRSSASTARIVGRSLAS